MGDLTDRIRRKFGLLPTLVPSTIQRIKAPAGAKLEDITSPPVDESNQPRGLAANPTIEDVHAACLGLLDREYAKILEYFQVEMYSAGLLRKKPSFSIQHEESGTSVHFVAYAWEEVPEGLYERQVPEYGDRDVIFPYNTPHSYCNTTHQEADGTQILCLQNFNKKEGGYKDAPVKFIFQFSVGSIDSANTMATKLNEERSVLRKAYMLGRAIAEFREENYELGRDIVQVQELLDDKNPFLRRKVYEEIKAGNVRLAGVFESITRPADDSQSLERKV